MSRSEEVGDGHDMAERERGPPESDEVQSLTHQIPTPPLLDEPVSRSQSTGSRTPSLKPSDTNRRDNNHRSKAREPRYGSSLKAGDASTRFSRTLPGPNLTRPGAAHGPRSLRSQSSPSVTTLSAIRRMAPSILSTSDTAYTYDYLDYGEFRLIILRPDRKDDPDNIVRCEMFTCPLWNSPPYVALSYAWGDVSDTRKIHMERSDITINVSASLESALRALRDPMKSVLVWADAVSINQQDTSEKANQVRLMTQIYQKAESVAVWLGPQSGDSDIGMGLVGKISRGAALPLEITKHTPPPFSEKDFAAAVALFDREYWHRLWVVQEVFNAQTINVYCGSLILPWEAFQTASGAFRKHKDILEQSFRPGYSNSLYQARFGRGYPHVLIHEGPGSLTRIGTRATFDDGKRLSDKAAYRDMLEIMRICRRKLTSNPQDKVFGLLGILSNKVRKEINVDYSIPVKDVYIDIFRGFVEKTKSLDIMCESIHFPTYTNNNSLPSWAPDWSHIPSVSPIATNQTCTFSASGKEEAVVDFRERNKIRIVAIPLGKVKEHGVAVGTQCKVNDYLMAFLQWRSCLEQFFDGVPALKLHWLKERFCLALSLDYTPNGYEANDWMDLCYHVFASTIRDRLPKLQIDRELEQYADRDSPMDHSKRRLFLQEHFGSNMMGRCFCITDQGGVGLGTGSMTHGDLVVVPLGCSTPVVLRPEGDGYRFVGDVYVQGYMYGRAVEDCKGKDPEREVRSYLIH